MRLKSKVKIVLITTLISNLTITNNSYAANCSPEITTNGSRTVVAFKTVGTCTWSTPAGATDFKGLIVAGGGGGGADLAGGGGGGGYVEFETLTATSDVFTVTVGDGGAGAVTNIRVAGSNGGNSTVVGTGVNLIARGGAGGATWYAGGYPAGANGGSGGGQAGYNATTSTKSNGTQTLQSQTPILSTIGGQQFGFDGSAGGNPYFPGGGGGAGGNGSNSPATGGSGRSNSILGTTYLWAGGGGGAGWSGVGGGGGSGGGGGGGSGSVSAGVGGVGGTGGLNNGGNGVYVGGGGGTNTGGGGGAGTHNNHAGGKGGSGIVVLSYLTFIGNTTISLQLASGVATAIYRSNSTIEALVGTAGRVTFYQAGKVIPGCKNRNSSGTAPNIKATCTWKPSTRGSVKISASINPTSASYALTNSAVFPVTVSARTTPR